MLGWLSGSKKKLNKRLRDAASEGNLAEVKKMLGKKAAIDDIDPESGNVALLLAIDGGHQDVALFLIKQGADVTFLPPDGYSPLMIAAYKGDEMQSVVHALLAAGADVNQSTISADDPGLKPLYLAAAGGSWIIFKSILEAGASLNVEVEGQLDLVSVAALGGAPEIIKYLHAEGKNIDLLQNDGRRAIHVAAISGHVDAVSCLLDLGIPTEATDVRGQTPLIGAALNGKAEVVKLLLERGANPNSVVTTEDGDFTPLVGAVHGGYDGVVQLLTDAGASASARYEKKTLIASARAAGNKSTVKILMAAKKKQEIKQESLKPKKAAPKKAAPKKAAPKRAAPKKAAPKKAAPKVEMYNEEIDQICRCAFLVAVADGDLSEDEATWLGKIRADIRNAIDARPAVELYQKTSDLQAARELYIPLGLDTVVYDGLDFIPEFFIAKTSDDFSASCKKYSIETVIASYALEIKDPYLQRIAAWACACVASADGDFSDNNESKMLSVICEFWGFIYEHNEWAILNLLPVLNGEEVLKDHLRDTLGEGHSEAELDQAYKELQDKSNLFDFHPDKNSMENEEMNEDDEFFNDQKNRNVLDTHFSFQEEIQRHYKNRQDPKRLAAAINACRQQIEYADQAMEAFKFLKMPSPEHHGYKQLAIILEKKGEFAEVIDICHQAKKQGWVGDWDKRVIRCRNKEGKR